MITIHQLSKSFHEKKVLENFSLQIADGEVLAIMGKSGIGKTTLLNIIAGLLTPDSGTVEGVPDKIAMVFQENRLLDDFSAYDNIRLITNAKHEDILKHFALLGLANEIDKPVKEYSGGMKRRVALLRAMLAESALLLLDEPFKGLDEETKESVITYTKKHLLGKTCILITHEPSEAQALGVDRVIAI